MSGSRNKKHPRPKAKRSRKGKGRPAAPRATQPRRSAHRRATAPSPRHDPIRSFLVHRSPKDPETARAALEILLRYGWGQKRLLRGGWVCHGLTELYVEGIPGYGDARGSRLVASFLRFLADEDLLDPWDHRRLAWEVDEARVARGLDPLGAEPAWDWARPGEELPNLLEAFLEQDTELTPLQRHVADVCLRYFATFGRGVTDHVCFGAISPSTMLERLTLGSNPPGSEQNLFLISAAFTRWLGVAKGFDVAPSVLLAGPSILEPTRANALAEELAQLALAFATPAACA